MSSTNFTSSSLEYFVPDISQFRYTLSYLWSTFFFALLSNTLIKRYETDIFQLIIYSPMFHFYTSWKRLKIFGFLIFSGWRYSNERLDQNKSSRAYYRNWGIGAIFCLLAPRKQKSFLTISNNFFSKTS